MLYPTKVVYQNTDYVVEEISIGVYFIRRRGFGKGVLCTVYNSDRLNQGNHCTDCGNEAGDCLHLEILWMAAKSCDAEMGVRDPHDTDYSIEDFVFESTTYHVIEPSICVFFVSEKGSGEGFFIDMCEDLAIWNCSVDGVGVKVEEPGQCWHGKMALEYIKFIDARDVGRNKPTE